MPHKQNSPTLEKVKLLVRGGMTNTVNAIWDAAEVTLERGLEDSAGKRSYLPESYFATDDILTALDRIIRGLNVYPSAIASNMNMFGPYAATEPILTKAVLRGADRQIAYQHLSDLSKIAVDAVRKGDQNPIRELVQANEYLSSHFADGEIDEIFESAPNHIGDATERAIEMALIIRERLKKS